MKNTVRSLLIEKTYLFLSHALWHIAFPNHFEIPINFNGGKHDPK